VKYSGLLSWLLYSVEGGGFVVFCWVVVCGADDEAVEVVGGGLCGVMVF
jgi:hypothetical protein